MCVKPIDTKMQTPVTHVVGGALTYAGTHAPTARAKKDGE